MRGILRFWPFSLEKTGAAGGELKAKSLAAVKTAYTTFGPGYVAHPLLIEYQAAPIGTDSRVAFIPPYLWLEGDGRFEWWRLCCSGGVEAATLGQLLGIHQTAGW